MGWLGSSSLSSTRAPNFSGPGMDIWRSFRFIGALMRSLCLLPGGLGRFVPRSIGANHCRHRHIGWEKCGHGLTSRPRARSSEPFFEWALRTSISLLVLLVRCLLVHFPFGFVLLDLLVGPLLGGYRCLDMLLVWLLLILGLLRVVGLRMLVGRFTGLVVLIEGGEEFD